MVQNENIQGFSITFRVVAMLIPIPFSLHDKFKYIFPYMYHKTYFVKQQKAEFNYLSDKITKIFKYLLGMNMENITEKANFLVISSI